MHLLSFIAVRRLHNRASQNRTEVGAQLRVGIFTNLRKDGDLAVTRRLIAELERRHVDYVLDADMRGKLSGDEYFSPDEPVKLDFMITVGGDGTILRIAKYCADMGLPIAGINLGHVGFLTEVEPDNVSELVSALVDGSYEQEKRSLIYAEFGGRYLHALNDVVISRAADSRMAEIDLRINGEFVDRYFCDGFIVSTPTGSTAYSLSAGGPILSPGISAFSLVSINSHSLHSRPIVVADSDVAEFTLCSVGRAELVVDGVACASMSKGDAVKIRKAQEEVVFVRLSGHGFFKKLLTKLNKWSTTEKED